MPTLLQSIGKTGIKSIQLACTQTPHGGSTAVRTFGTKQQPSLSAIPPVKASTSAQQIQLNKASNKRYYYPTVKSRLDLRTIKHPHGITT
jgi:hypothetical protein